MSLRDRLERTGRYVTPPSLAKRLGRLDFSYSWTKTKIQVADATNTRTCLIFETQSTRKSTAPVAYSFLADTNAARNHGFVAEHGQISSLVHLFRVDSIDGQGA